MTPINDVYVILVAAGRGTRMTAGQPESVQPASPVNPLPKQYQACAGLPVLRHSILTFAQLVPTTRILTAIHPDHMEFYQSSVAGIENFPPPIHGGQTRQHSVANVLEKIAHDYPTTPDTLILIHDVARPCVSLDDIASVLAAAREHGAASLCHTVSNTMREVERRGVENLADSPRFLGKIHDRDRLLALETPQAARLNLLQDAYKKFAANLHDFTDETSLISALPHPVCAVISTSPNPKITYPSDMAYAEFLLHEGQSPPQHFSQQKSIFKTAMGYDVHGFGEEASSVRMGGISIPHTHKLLGHSDADVVLHAITDALLGLIGAGDIGGHFPPSDPTHRNRDSEDFVRHACGLLHAANGTLHHVDVTIICEAPKIGPVREAMRARISEILSLDLSQVSIKATTSEGLGFTGRREGIAAYALASAEFAAPPPSTDKGARLCSTK